MIGVFDSGYGGLTVLKEFLKTLPRYDYLYLGDNARTPYGNRSAETLVEFAEQAVEFLFDQGCTVIIFACNTLSSAALRHVQEKYLRTPGIRDRKILGVIRPLAEASIKITRNRRIGVVGTRSTVAAKGYTAEIQKIEPNIAVREQPCPLLVPLIEENYHRKPEARIILKKYVRPLKNANVDTLILGCTHYPAMYRNFTKIMGKNVQVLRPGEIVAKSLKEYLARHPDIEKTIGQNAKRIFYTTDDPGRFRELGSIFMEQDLPPIHKIKIS